LRPLLLKYIRTKYIAVKYKCIAVKYTIESHYWFESQMFPDSEDKTTANWMKEAKKGHIRIAVLILLNNKPSHGYEIMKEIKDRTRGFYKPTPGGVYPILRDLEKTGYIKGEWHKQNNRNIKTYRITEKGKIILRNAIVKQSEIANNMNALFQEFARDVLNIGSSAVPMPVMPNPFAVFLEEKTKKTSNVEKLEHQRRQLKQHIRMIQERLKSIEKELAEEKAKKVNKK
jgi:DNA-binding PadR family transcriptional regulator